MHDQSCPFYTTQCARKQATMSQVGQSVSNPCLSWESMVVMGVVLESVFTTGNPMAKELKNKHSLIYSVCSN